MNKIAQLQQPAGETLIQLSKIACNLEHIPYSEIINTRLMYDGDECSGLMVLAKVMAAMNQVLCATTCYYKEHQE